MTYGLASTKIPAPKTGQIGTMTSTHVLVGGPEPEHAKSGLDLTGALLIAPDAASEGTCQGNHKG